MTPARTFRVALAVLAGLLMGAPARAADLTVSAADGFGETVSLGNVALFPTVIKTDLTIARHTTQSAVSRAAP